MKTLTKVPPSMIQELIKALASVGVAVNDHDVDEILVIGIDAFLSRKGIDLSAKFLDCAYIILNEMKSR